MNKFEEKTIHTEKVYQGKIIDLEIDDVILPNEQTSKREIVRHPGAVAILALTDEGKIIMVEQYRKPLGKSIIEIPAGKLEPGEKSEKTAERELEEETGYAARQFEFIVSYYTSPGFADEKIELFLAKDLYKVEEQSMGDEDEFVELIELTPTQAIEYIKQEKIHDAKTIHAVYYTVMKEV